jgi:hypothetical protein
VLAFLTDAAVPAPEAHYRAASLVIVKSHREIHLPAMSAIVLGRRDQEHNIKPNVDLTPDGAARYGVSRRHARIHQMREGTFVEDLGSTNGTFINGQRLFPAKLYPLEHGDMLHLGRLKLAITLYSDATAVHSSVDQVLDRGTPVPVDSPSARDSHRTHLS